MVNPAERYASVDGIRVRYLEAGQGEPLLLLHGLGGVAEEWLPIMEGLEAAYHVLAPDLPGCGLSDKPAVRYTSRYFARIIRGLMAALGVASAYVAGHSLGGGVALEIGVSYPDVCRKLVLLAPAGLSRRVGLAIRVLATPGLGELVVRRRRSRHSVAASPDRAPDHAEVVRAAKLRARATSGWKEAVLGTVRASVTPLGLRSTVTSRAHRHAPDIRTPTLFLWGDRDRTVPLRGSLWVRDRLPGARLVVLPGLTHDLHLEDPVAITRLIRCFLADSDYWARATHT